MAVLTIIDGMRLYSDPNEALREALRMGLSGYHTHTFNGRIGYMAGYTHTFGPSTPTTPGQNVRRAAVQRPQRTQTPPLPSINRTPATTRRVTTSTSSSSGGGGGY